MLNTATTLTSFLPRAGRILVASAALLGAFTATAHAGDYGSSGGNYGGGHYSSGGSHSYSNTTTTYSAPRTYNYTNSYYDGGGGRFNNYSSSENDSNGYNGPDTYINTPHRADWEAKLAAQRRWDEDQYKKYQQAGGGIKCGFTGSPAYCYKLEGPYPSEMRIVRY